MSVVTLKKSEVPVYLQTSGFYSSLDFEGDEEITVPADCFKLDDSVASVDDLRRLCSTLRFWCAPCLPISALDFVFSTTAPKSETSNVLAQFNKDLQLDQLVELCLCCDTDRLWLVMERDNLLMLKYFESRGAEINVEWFVAACEHNSLQCLTYICSKGTEGFPCPLKNTLYIMILKGHLRCLQYLHSQGFDVITSQAIALASRNDHVDVLIWYLSLHSPQIGARNVCYSAAQMGGVKCFKYAYEKGYSPAGQDRFLMQAARHVEIVKYLHARGVPFAANACNNAAGHGGLPLLQYLHEQGCAWTVDTVAIAAGGGHLHCLQYLLAHGCPWDQTAFTTAARYGHVQCLTYLWDSGCEGDAAAAMSTAVQHSQLRVLQFIHEYGFSLHPALCAQAMQSGHLSCLTYLHEHGVAWGDTNTDEAAKSGFYGCVTYAHEHGCPWGPNTCMNAATYGQLTCLQYAYEHGAPFDIAVYRDSSVFRHPACSEYIAAQLAMLLD